jgi:HSP20 family protein
MTTTTSLEKAEEKIVRRRRDPFDLFDDMREELARFWGEPWLFAPRRPMSAPKKAEVLHPRVDIYERNDTLIIKTDLPGLKKEDIQVSIDEGDLIIQGQSKAENELKEEDYYRWERAAGRFYRRLGLPFETKLDKIEASFKDGVLEIRIPKAPNKKPEPKKIEVH